jgi:hypothetical protein
MNRLLIVFLVAILMITTASAQTSNATVGGTVSDELLSSASTLSMF